MNEILQGTTPSLEIKISTNDFLVTDVLMLEFVMNHNLNNYTYGLEDVTVDSEANSFIYEFTEAETLALVPGKPIRYQLRFKFADGSIVGTPIMSLQVSDLISQEAMSE